MIRRRQDNQKSSFYKRFKQNPSFLDLLYVVSFSQYPDEIYLKSLFLMFLRVKYDEPIKDFEPTCSDQEFTRITIKVICSELDFFKITEKFLERQLSTSLNPTPQINFSDFFRFFQNFKKSPKIRKTFLIESYQLTITK